MSVKKKTPKPEHELPAGTVKRSLTISRAVDAHVKAAVGPGGYSAFMNDAALMALQARGVREWLSEFEAEYGAITDDELRETGARLAAADEEARR